MVGAIGIVAAGQAAAQGGQAPQPGAQEQPGMQPGQMQGQMQGQPGMQQGQMQGQMQGLTPRDEQQIYAASVSSRLDAVESRLDSLKSVTLPTAAKEELSDVRRDVRDLRGMARRVTDRSGPQWIAMHDEIEQRFDEVNLGLANVAVSGSPEVVNLLFAPEARARTGERAQPGEMEKGEMEKSDPAAGKTSDSAAHEGAHKGDVTGSADVDAEKEEVQGSAAPVDGQDTAERQRTGERATPAAAKSGTVFGIQLDTKTPYTQHVFTKLQRLETIADHLQTVGQSVGGESQQGIMDAVQGLRDRGRIAADHTRNLVKVGDRNQWISLHDNIETAFFDANAHVADAFTALDQNTVAMTRAGERTKSPQE